jgi:hypothetical protein
MPTALLVSMLVHVLLLGIALGGQSFGLPGLNFAWKEPRFGADDLRISLAPAPIVPEATPPAPMPASAIVDNAPVPVAVPGEMAAVVLPPAPPVPAPTSLATPVITARQPSDVILPVSPETVAPDPRAQERAREQARLRDAELAAAQREAAQEEQAKQTMARAEAARQAQLDAIEQDAARQAALKQEAARQALAQQAQLEAARRMQQETARQDAAKQEAAREEQVKQAELYAAKQENARQEAARQDAAREELARQARQEAARQEQARQAQQEAARQEQARQAQQEAARQEQARQAQREAARQEELKQAQREAARQEELKQAPLRQEQAKQALAQQARADQEAAREERLRAIGQQMKQDAAQRNAAEGNPSRSLLPGFSSLRRGYLLSRADANTALVQYAADMARKIELNLTFDMVRDAAQQPHVAPIVTVAVRADGSVEKVTFVVASGVPRLDEAIRQVIASQASFAAFPPALARQYDVVEIRRTWVIDTAIRLQ